MDFSREDGVSLKSGGPQMTVEKIVPRNSVNPEVETLTQRQMRVAAWSNGGGRTYGIRVGSDNRQKFFDPAWEWIEVEIDGNLHKFQLTPGFWNHCPEFRDSGTTVIQEWLRRNYKIPWEKDNLPRFFLEIVCNQRFRLVKDDRG